MVRAYWVASLDSSFPTALVRRLSRMLQTVSSSTPSSHFPTARSLGNAAGASCSNWWSTLSSTWDAWNLKGINTARTRYLCKQSCMAQGEKGNKMWYFIGFCPHIPFRIQHAYQTFGCISYTGYVYNSHWNIMYTRQMHSSSSKKDNKIVLNWSTKSTWPQQGITVPWRVHSLLLVVCIVHGTGGAQFPFLPHQTHWSGTVSPALHSQDRRMQMAMPR